MRRTDYHREYYRQNAEKLAARRARQKQRARWYGAMTHLRHNTPEGWARWLIGQVLRDLGPGNVLRDRAGKFRGYAR